MLIPKLFAMSEFTEVDLTGRHPLRFVENVHQMAIPSNIQAEHLFSIYRTVFKIRAFELRPR
jgi:hypothetical protein